MYLDKRLIFSDKKVFVIEFATEYFNGKSFCIKLNSVTKWCQFVIEIFL